MSTIAAWIPVLEPGIRIIPFDAPPP
eukprot:SAG11_NODE_15265_length_583_cov_1.688017_1_plen_25_part_10